MQQFVVQGIGILGLALVVLSFQRDRRQFTLLVQLGAAAIFAMHFGLLGAMAGTAMNLLSGLRAAVFSLRERYAWASSRWVMRGFVAAFWFAAIPTWDGPIVLLPIASMTLECVALWQADTTRLRWLYLAARPGWIIYDLLVGSLAGLLTEAFIIGSVIVAIKRFHA